MSWLELAYIKKIGTKIFKVGDKVQLVKYLDKSLNGWTGIVTKLDGPLIRLKLNDKTQSYYNHFYVYNNEIELVMGQPAPVGTIWEGVGSFWVKYEQGIYCHSKYSVKGSFKSAATETDLNTNQKRLN